MRRITEKSRKNVKIIPIKSESISAMQIQPTKHFPNFYRFFVIQNWKIKISNLHIYLPRDRTGHLPVAPADRTRRRPPACEADRPSWDRLREKAPPGPGSCGSSGVARPDAARFRPATRPTPIRCAATWGSGAAPRKCWRRWNRPTVSSNPVETNQIWNN